MGKRLKRMANGTAEIDDAGWEQLKTRLRGLATGAFVKVGVVAEHGAGDAVSDSDGDINMAELASVHEYGSPAAGIPARSFIRRTFVEQEGELAKFCAKATERVFEGKVTEERALDLIGAWSAAQVKKTIARGPHIPPPLKPATVKAKGSTRPLVDTGHLANSINHAVVR